MKPIIFICSTRTVCQKKIGSLIPRQSTEMRIFQVGQSLSMYELMRYSPDYIVQGEEEFRIYIVENDALKELASFQS